MNILSVSLDKGLFDKHSDVYWRHVQYASYVDGYTVIVNTQKFESKQSFTLGKLTIIPTNSRFKILAPLDALIISKSLNCDLVTTQDPFLTGIAGIFIKLFKRVPLNIQIHSEFFNSKYYREEKLLNSFFYFLGLFTLKFADTVRARNKHIKEWVIDNYPNLKGKAFYVSAAINEIFLTKLSNSKRVPNLIVTNGRLTAQKNYPLLLVSFQAVLKLIPEAKLWIIGVGEDELKIKGLEGKMKLNGHLKFFGWVEPRKWKNILDKATLFVLASNHEGWGLVALEALARGTPVVMTDTGCAGEIILNEKTGIVVSVEDQRALTASMIKTLSETEKYQKFARQGRQLVREDSSPGFIKKSMLKMFHATSSQRQ